MAINLSTLVNQTNPLQLAKAWINFGYVTGSIVYRANYNVSSITRNGTGDYTITFTNAMTDANYIVVGSCTDSLSGGGRFFTFPYTSSPTTSAFRFATYTSTPTIYDMVYISVAIFGN